MSDPLPRLHVGPLLRWVDETRATVWVETDRAGSVRVLDTETATWSVHGHHFALVVLEGLEPGSETPYDVRVDGNVVYPPADSPFPAPAIRTPKPGEPVRLSFGSCRALGSYDPAGLRSHGPDALVALAERAARGDEPAPTMLVLLGDQVYADEPDEEMKQRLRQRPGVSKDVLEEISTFDEYTWLYEKTWSHPALRWLLATTPSAMILDDHDLRDDWNTSWSWRQEMSAKPWWRDRVLGGFGSYWVYQHLGNLSPDELASDATYLAITGAATEQERDGILDAMAWRSDAEPTSARWSYVRDIGPARLVMIDSRCTRSLEPGHRGMVDAVEWEWLAQHLRGDVDHLLVGTSLPWLMQPTVHELEGWNEATAHGVWGRVFGGLAERLRQAVDLEHWAAFRSSFDALSDTLVAIARGQRGSRPHSVLVLSGDVHLSYAARARFAGDGDAAPVWQLTTSPFRNPLSAVIRRVDQVLGLRPVQRAVTWLARRAGVPAASLQWEADHGPFFDNAVSTLVLDGAQARLQVDLARLGPHDEQLLHRALDEVVSGG